MGRLLPQMVYYFHAVAQAAHKSAARKSSFCTPSGNFGNLTAGPLANAPACRSRVLSRRPMPTMSCRRICDTGRFEPRRRCRRLRTRWTSATRVTSSACVAVRRRSRRDAPRCRRQPPQRRRGACDDQTRIRGARISNGSAQRDRVPRPHAVPQRAGRAGRGRKGGERQEGRDGRIGIFLATAHPAKFSEIVEPILGHPIDTPAPLANALAQPRHVLKINASFDAVRRTLDS